MPALVLDSEALNRLVHVRRDEATERLRAAMRAAVQRGWVVRVPSLVLAELARTSDRATALQQRMNAFGLTTANVGPKTAKHAGWLLGRHDLNGCSMVDATVVATAVRFGGGVISTGDPDDLTALAADEMNVRIQTL